MSEIFNGHLEQIDYQDNVIRGLHLVSLDGERLLIKIDPPEEPWPPFNLKSGPLAFLNRDARPPVTIERER